MIVLVLGRSFLQPKFPISAFLEVQLPGRQLFSAAAVCCKAEGKGTATWS